MLLLIPYIFTSDDFDGMDLNTSNVTVNLVYYNWIFFFNINLNTSNVTVNQYFYLYSHKYHPYLNTSNVTVNPFLVTINTSTNTI